MLVRPGLEDLFLNDYDYVGAPWIYGEANKQLLTMANPQLVGNGGFSLRNVKMHLEIARTTSAAKKLELFNHNLQPIPEDVFFAGQIYTRGGRIHDHKNAQLFSSEEVVNLDSIGFHKPWAYNWTMTCEFFKRLLE